MSKTDGGAWLCLCVGNESISFTPVPLPSRGGRGGWGGRRLVYRWPVCFLSLLTYARAILSSLFSVSFVSQSPSDRLCLRARRLNRSSLSASHRVASPSFPQYLHFLLFCLFLSPEHSIPHSLTLSAPVYYRSIWPFHYVAFKNHPEKGDRNRRSTVVAHPLACIWCNDPKPKLLLL